MFRVSVFSVDQLQQLERFPVDRRFRIGQFLAGLDIVGALALLQFFRRKPGPHSRHHDLRATVVALVDDLLAVRRVVEAGHLDGGVLRNGLRQRRRQAAIDLGRWRLVDFGLHGLALHVSGIVAAAGSAQRNLFGLDRSEQLLHGLYVGRRNCRSRCGWRHGCSKCGSGDDQ
jgi:hypothetical protein